MSKTVLTVGIFDYFHYGHLRLFERAKKYGDKLIVAVQDGNFILKYKPQANIMYTTEQRLELVKSLRVVDDVVVYRDVDEIVKEVNFDVFVLGGDQNHIGFQRAEEWCHQNNKEVVRLERTKGISSSMIKVNLENLK